MNVSCPECQSVFRVDPARVPGPGIRARCSVCGGIIPITTVDGQAIAFKAQVLLLTPKEVEYFRHGGILHFVLRQLAGRKAA